MATQNNVIVMKDCETDKQQNVRLDKLENQVSGNGSINTSGDIRGANVYGTNFNLNSLLNNFESNILGQDKFKLTVDAFGNLKIVPQLNLNSSNYKAKVEIDNSGRYTVTGDDIQSCMYMVQLVMTLVNPADIGQRRLFTCGYSADPAGNLCANYIKMKLIELEVDGKIPPVLYSLGKAISEANNDAYDLVLSKFRNNMRKLSIIDGVVLAIGFAHVLSADCLFSVFTNMFTNTWLQYVLFQNNLGPKPSGLNQDLDIPNKENKASAYLKLGKNYLSDGNSVSIGSPHWYNVGTWNLQNIRMIISKENLEFTLGFIGSIPVPFLFGWNKNSLFDSSSVGYGDSIYLPYVNLVDISGSSYYIGNTVNSIDFEGPVIMDWPSNSNTIQTLGGSYTSSNTKKLELNIPCTKYGPIVGWDSTNNRVYSLPNKVNSDFLVACEKAYTEWLFLISTQDRINYINKYGGLWGLSNDFAFADKNGNIAAYCVKTQQVLPYSKIYRNCANTCYNPSTPTDINFCNISHRGGFFYNILNGSDPDVYTSLCHSSNEWGQDNLGNVRGEIVVSTDVVQTCVQHSNTQVIDLAPVFNYDVMKAAVDINFNPRLLLNLVGTVNGVKNPLEDTRVNNFDVYIEMMSQIQTYSYLPTKANNIYNMLYANLGLITIDKSGNTTFVSDINEWKNPTKKLTTKQALNLDYDKISYKMKKSLPGVVAYLESYFTNNEPDWNSPYLAAVITQGTAGTGNIRFIDSNQAKNAVNKAVCLDAVKVLKNWNHDYEINSVGAFLNQIFWQRVQTRIRAFALTQLAALQKSNSLFSNLPAFSDSSNMSLDNYYNDICLPENKYTWLDAIPNFKKNDNNVYVKERDLTEDDRWRIFQRRVSTGFGFDANGLLEVGKNATGTGLNTPPVNNGQLMHECFIAALLDIYQCNDTIKVALCNDKGDLTFVTSTARTDTPANNIADKIRRPWGYMHTFVYPLDFDSSGNFIQYAMPYDQDSWIGGGITEFRQTVNFSVIGGGYTGYVTGYTFPNTDLKASYTGVTASNRPASVNQIFNGSPNRPFFRDGFLGIVGGAAFMLNSSFDKNGKSNLAFRNSFGADATNSLLYRKSLYYIQNDITPVQGNEPTVFSLSSKNEYNRDNMAKALKFKENGSTITY